MNQDYLSVLITELRCHKLIKCEPQLSSEKWNKSAFELCSKIISDSLLNSFSEKDMIKFGTSISYKTLQSIFRHTYKVKYPIDPRSLSTLTKIVRFLGYNSWTDFVNNSTESDASVQTEEINLIDFIKGAVSNSFDAISDLTTSALEKYYDSQYSAFKMLDEVISHNKSNQNIINNPSNPSTVEILDIEVENIDENTARVKTKEYWLLCWWNKEQNKYTTRLKDINDHMYTLIKEKQNWRILNDVTISDKYELQMMEEK